MRRLAILVVGCLAVAAPLVAPADAKHRLGRYYGGVTNQGDPFAFRLARGSTAVDSAHIMVSGNCANGGSVAYFGKLSFGAHVPASVALGEHVVSPRRVSRSRRFRAGGVGSESFRTLRGAIKESISGRIRRNGAATGSYHATVTVTDRDMTVLTTCETGAVRWTARSARGRIYTGAIGDALPVVLELNAKRSSVAHLRFAWAAPCKPVGNLLIPEDFTDLSLSGGHFGDAFERSFDLEGGDKRAFDYDLDGRVRSRRRASGSASVKVRETNPAGAVVATCDTGKLSWSARSG